MKKSFLWLLLVGGLLAAASARPRLNSVCAGKDPSLAADLQGGLHLAYEGSRAGNDIYYRSSVDGRSWSEEVNVSNSSGISSEPALAVERSGAVDVVWADTTSGSDHPDIYFARTGDAGKTWSTALDVSRTPRLSRSPSVAVGPHDSLHVCWVDTSRGRSFPDLYYVFSYNHGQSWSKPALISGSTGVTSRPALVASADGQIHVAWADGGSRPAIRYIHGQADGWASARALGNGFCSQPCLAVGPRDQVLLGWIGQLRSHESPNVYLYPLGSTQSVNVSRTPGTSRDPALAIGATGPVLSWIDTTSGASTPDVWMSVGGRVLDVSHTPGVSRMPVLAPVKGKVWVLWEELELGSCWLKLTSVPVKGT
ncbi:exo-alpha-sialidase [bacterium]|nr:exo-alpha-sialidase [bacterium]